MSRQHDDGFLGRWSRRKAQARAGQPEPAPMPAEPAVPTVPAAAAAPPDIEAERALADAPAPAAAAPAAVDAEAGSPTLDDVRALSTESDFRPFVARAVAPEVRNAAFRKLFSDPHFKLMDGLDVYIDDYGRPDPLPESALRQMASARFLRLFEEAEQQPAPGSAPSGPAVGAEAAAAAAPVPALPPVPAPDRLPAQASSPPPAGEGDVAQFDLCSHLPTLPPEVAANHVPDSDLRLQPDHAAGRRADRSGAA